MSAIAAAICGPSSGSLGSSTCIENSPSAHVRNSSRSPVGRPSSSAMTITGSGNASASTRSNRSPTASRSSPLTARMRGSRAATVRGVNAALTRWRRARCSGGSIWVSMPRRVGAAAGTSREVSEENVAGSRVMASTSAWRNTCQMP